jgi:hypothetical protein
MLFSLRMFPLSGSSPPFDLDSLDVDPVNVSPLPLPPVPTHGPVAPAYATRGSVAFARAMRGPIVSDRAMHGTILLGTCGSFPRSHPHLPATCVAQSTGPPYQRVTHAEPPVHHLVAIDHQVTSIRVRVFCSI